MGVQVDVCERVLRALQVRGPETRSQSHFFPFPTACDKSLKAVNRHSEFHILDLAPVPNNQSRLVRNLSYIKPFSGGSRRNSKVVTTLPTATLMTTS